MEIQKWYNNHLTITLSLNYADENKLLLSKT